MGRTGLQPQAHSPDRPSRKSKKMTLLYVHQKGQRMPKRPTATFKMSHRLKQPTNQVETETKFCGNLTGFFKFHFVRPRSNKEICNYNNLPHNLKNSLPVADPGIAGGGV